MFIIAKKISTEWGVRMPEKTDRRQVRTKRLLRRALMELIAEKGSDAITVTDIAGRADVNRGTFYLHYRDVPDMLEQIKEEALNAVVGLIRQLDLEEMINSARRDEPNPKVIAVFEEFARYADVFETMFGPNGDVAYPLRIREAMKNHFYSRLANLQSQGELLSVPIDYFFAYITSANLGVVMHWFESGRKESPSEIALLMARIILRGPLAAAGVLELLKRQ